MRKPPEWMLQLAPHGNPAHLTPVICSCGLWTFSDRDQTMWTAWDAGIIQGDDLTIAIILRRPLIRLRHVPGVATCRLETVFGSAGISPDGQYLALHECGRMPISTTPYKPPADSKQMQDLSWMPETRPSGPDPWGGIIQEKELTLFDEQT